MFEQAVPAGGAPISAHLKQAAKTLRLPEETFAPKGNVPPGLEFVWEIFLDLSTTRTHSGYAPNPISYLEVVSASQLYGVTIDPMTLSAIRKLDSVWMEVQIARLSAAQSRDK